MDIKRQRIQIHDNTEGAMGVTCTLTRIVKSESCVTNIQADELYRSVRTLQETLGIQSSVQETQHMSVLREHKLRT